MSRLIREFIEAAFLALLFFSILRVSIENFRVVGASMQETLEEGEYLLVNKLVYLRIDLQRLAQLTPFWDVEEEDVLFAFDPPQRGDVIVFRAPREPDRNFVKRVIGLPGEEVTIRNGTVYVDGRPLHEPYITNPALRETQRFPRLGERDYFVLGDNRSGSNDSRDWGPVPLENVIGKVWLTYWPFSDLGLLPNPN